MKILVTYFSQSGNTAKIAKAIHEEAGKTAEADLKTLDELTVEMVAEYDFIFMGSPIHSASLADPVKKYLTLLKGSVGQQMAGFVTHMTITYPKQDIETFADPMKSACKEKGIEYKGCFDCQGFLTENMHEPVQKMLKTDDKKWAELVQQMTGRPNQEDVNAAKAFTKELLK